MTNRIRPWFFLCAALLIATVAGNSAQTPLPASKVQSLALAEKLPPDPAVTIGTFPNGLRYYIRKNKRAEGYAQLRLVVKAGSVLEDDDQRGLAHFVEHMAFNGTRNFPKQELAAFIQSLGMRFGSDLNASTGYDQTIYQLRVPTADPAVMDRAFLVLADWAQHITFDDAEVENERGVVMEEWRLRRSAGTRTSEKIDPVWWKGTPYAERLPIGKPEIIQNARTERLKKFYTDWYRPDLMAVIAVGDFDPATIETLVRKHLSGVPSPAAPRPRPYYEIPDHPGTVYVVAADKEMTSSWVEIDNLLPGRERGTVAAYRQRIVDDLFSTMLTNRFDELARRPDPPFIGASATRDLWGGRACDTCNPREDAWLYAQVKDGGAERALQALLTEAARVSQFGFTATELERTKRALLRSYENRATEDVNRTHDVRVNEYIRHFLDHSPIPTAADEYALHQRFLPEISLTEVNRLAAEWFPRGNRFVTLAAPEKAGLVLPSEARLRAVVDADPGPLRPYVDSIATARLLESMPAPGNISTATQREAIGITEWVLSNGARVVLKPTTFSEDQIIFRAMSPGGSSLASDADYIPASTAAQIVTAGGVGSLNAIDLEKFLAGTLASVNPFIAELEEGLTGSSTRKDLETMFQLIHLRFTQPRSDPSAVSVLADRTRGNMANLSASPDFLYSQTLAETSFQNHLRRRQSTAQTVDGWNLEKSLAFYKDRFADASDFTFLFVGSFDVATMRPLVERYIGSLPSLYRKESWKDVGVRRPTAMIERTVEKGVEPRGRTTLVFSGPFVDTEANRIAFQAMTEILSRRLLEVVREELGAAYTISANPGIQREPNPEYSITVQLGHDPARTEDLLGRVLKEIDQFKLNGPTTAQVNDEKLALIRNFDNGTKQNAYLLNQLSQRYRFGEDPALVWQLGKVFEALDVAAIQQAARTHLDTKRYVRVTLLPEKR